ncbi:MAG: esterase family protein [Leptospirales bacterium]|nr:esterase family protein [Leptospirales bacterium]
MKRIHALICSICLLAACETASHREVSSPISFSSDYSGSATPGSWVYDKITYTYNGESASVNLQLYFPKTYKASTPARTLIVFHGYRGRQGDWNNNTRISVLADQYSFVLVCPSMGTTLYESAYFPETINKWGPLPGGLFVSDVLVPYLRKKFSVATNAKFTGVFGNSTGGRGALLAAARNPEFFGATGGVSGDYDPVSMSQNRLLVSVYGPYKDFEKRWQNTDNLMEMAVNLKGIPVFLAHGDKDSVVEKEQAILMSLKLNQLEKKGGNYPKVSKIYPYKMHDWDCWRAALSAAMIFFDGNLSK